MKLFDNENILMFDRLNSCHAEVNVMMAYYNVKRAATYIVLFHAIFFASFGQYDNIYGWTFIFWLMPFGYIIEFFLFMVVDEFRGKDVSKQKK